MHWTVQEYYSHGHWHRCTICWRICGAANRARRRSKDLLCGVICSLTFLKASRIVRVSHLVFPGGPHQQCRGWNNRPGLVFRRSGTRDPGNNLAPQTPLPPPRPKRPGLPSAGGPLQGCSLSQQQEGRKRHATNNTTSSSHSGMGIRSTHPTPLALWSLTDINFPVVRA